MEEQSTSKPSSKAKSKRKALRIYGRLSHKKDLEAWDELRQRDEFIDAADGEILRQAVRALADSFRIADQLEGYEKRMAGSLKSLHRRLDQIESAQHIQISFLEVLMRTYYYHTMPVPKEAHRQAMADAMRRIDKFIEDVAGTLQKGGAMQELTIRLMDSDAGMGNG